jgi:hypothetical protein
MREPSPQAIAYRAMSIILEVMLDEREFSSNRFYDRETEKKLAATVVMLNQLADVTTFHDTELTSQLHLCRRLILGK